MPRHRTYLEPASFPEVGGAFMEHMLAPNQPRLSGLVGEPITGEDLDLPYQELLPEIDDLSVGFNQLNLSDHLHPQPTGSNGYIQNTQNDYSVNCGEACTEKRFRVSPVRSSLGYFPDTLEAYRKLKLPLVISVTPFYRQEPVPSLSSLLRCKGCRAFPHARAQITESFDEWTCSICGAWTEIPREAQVEFSEKWVQIVSSPVIEYMSTDKPSLNPAPMPFYIFIIDVSFSAICNSMLSNVIFSIKELLHKLPEDTRIGFITVDSSVQYYYFTTEADYPSMLVVSEFEDGYLPLPIDALVVRRGSHMPAIDIFLDSLEMFFETSRRAENCIGSVLKALATAEYSGPGSLLVFQTALPNIGEGILVKTGGVSMLGTDKEYKLLSEKTRFYRNFTFSFNEKGTSVDFFIFNSDFDLPSVGGYFKLQLNFKVPLSRNTGGLVHYYPNFRSGEASQEVFFRDLETVLERQAHSPLIKNVPPRGLYVSGIFGGLVQVASSALFGATTNYGDSLYFVCDFDEGMIYFDTSLGKVISFQATVEYVNAKGQSLVRVINYSLPATSSIELISGSLNAAVYASYLLRQQAMMAPLTPMHRIRTILKECVRSYLSTTHSPAKPLLVPHSARALPYFIHAALKHPSFQAGSQVSPNDRIVAHQTLIRSAPELIINLICPPLLQLGSPYQTTRLNLSSEHVSKPGIYLLYFDHQVWCWVNGVVASTLQAYFNVDSYHALAAGQVSLDSLPPLLFLALKSHFTHACPRSIFIIKDDPTQAHWRQSFLSRLIEDQNQLGPSYQQYLKELMAQLTNP